MDIEKSIAPCTCCYTTLWNINVRKQAINDVLQGSVQGTYLRRDGVVNNQLRKVYCWVLEWKQFKIGEHLAKLQARAWLSRALSSSFSSVLARRAWVCGPTFVGEFIVFNASPDLELLLNWRRVLSCVNFWHVFSKKTRCWIEWRFAGCLTSVSTLGHKGRNVCWPHRGNTH